MWSQDSYNATTQRLWYHLHKAIIHVYQVHTLWIYDFHIWWLNHQTWWPQVYGMIMATSSEETLHWQCVMWVIPTHILLCVPSHLQIPTHLYGVYIICPRIRSYLLWWVYQSCFGWTYLHQFMLYTSLVLFKYITHSFFTTGSKDDKAIGFLKIKVTRSKLSFLLPHKVQPDEHDE